MLQITNKRYNALEKIFNELSQGDKEKTLMTLANSYEPGNFLSSKGYYDYEGALKNLSSFRVIKKIKGGKDSFGSLETTDLVRFKKMTNDFLFVETVKEREEIRIKRKNFFMLIFR